MEYLSTPETPGSQLFLTDIVVGTDTTFLPFEEPSQTQALLNEVVRIRQATMVGLGLRLKTLYSALYTKHGIRHAIENFIELDPVPRYKLVVYPPFAAWLQETVRLSNCGVGNSTDYESLDIYLSDLERIVSDFHQYVANQDDGLIIPGTSIRVQRFGVDQILKRVIPPSYHFPENEPGPQSPELDSGYSLDLFVEAISIALQRIRQVCPAAYADISRFVHIIIHLNKVNFRSCSADRYVGVILMSAQDYSILDMEESLIHEFGHQLLYNIMEVDQLLKNPRAEQKFRLPWSGSTRDVLGYFHAFYIYILLAMYYQKITGRSKSEQELAYLRFSEIKRGLEQAASDFDVSDFTPMGERFLGLLRRHVLLLDDQASHSCSDFSVEDSIRKRKRK